MTSKTFRFSVIFCSLLFAGAGCFSLSNDSNSNTSGPAGVFVSSDSGETWQQISSLPTNEGVKSISGVKVYRFFDDPQDPKAIYMGSRGKGMYFSYDEGRSWQEAMGALGKGFVYAIQVHPDNKCLLYGTTGFKVYKSDDCSRSWKEVHREDRSNARITSILIDPHGEHNVYVGKVNGELLLTENEGETWRILKKVKADIRALLADPEIEGRFYIASKKKGLYRSEDSGVTWKRFIKPLQEFAKANEYRRIFTHTTKGNELYWTSTYGILKSADGGESWESVPLITSPGSRRIYGFAVNAQDDDNMYYTTFDGSRSTFYRTLDGGKTWSTHKLPSGQVPTVLRVHPNDGSIVYIGFTVPSS